MVEQARGVIVKADEKRREGWGNPARGSASWFTFFSSDLTATTGMSAGLMEVPPSGGRLEPHRHQQAELYFVAEGQGILTIEGVDTAIAAGTAAFIPGDAEHAVRNETSTVLKIFYVFPTDRFADVVYRFPDTERS